MPLCPTFGANNLSGLYKSLRPTVTGRRQNTPNLDVFNGRSSKKKDWQYCFVDCVVGGAGYWEKMFALCLQSGHYLLYL